MDNKKYANGLIGGSSLNAALDNIDACNAVLYPLRALKRIVEQQTTDRPTLMCEAYAERIRKDKEETKQIQDGGNISI